jgi:hypothetical protein
VKEFEEVIPKRIVNEIEEDNWKFQQETIVTSDGYIDLLLKMAEVYDPSNPSVIDVLLPIFFKVVLKRDHRVEEFA